MSNVPDQSNSAEEFAALRQRVEILEQQMRQLLPNKPEAPPPEDFFKAAYSDAGTRAIAEVGGGEGQ